ncbi:hypothetical protein ACGC1H_003403 [Rhizoctonia solani]
MYIPPGALPPSLKSSNTRKKIEKGEQVRKLAYVLEINENDIVVAYTTTIGKKKALDEHVTDINDWYPVSPAPKNGTRDPLPAPENETSPNPAWINVKQAIRIPWTNKIAPKQEILPRESLDLILKAINPDVKVSASTATNEDTNFHQQIQNLRDINMPEYSKCRFWQGHTLFHSQSAEFWYKEQDQDFYVNVIDHPDTLAHSILTGQADLPEYGKHLCISGDEVNVVLSPPARPSALDDYEDCSEDLSHLQLIEVDGSIHFTKPPSHKSEIQALLKLEGSTRVTQLLGRSADNHLVFPKYKGNLFKTVLSHPVAGKIASIKRWMLEIIDAVAELHKAEIIHQDLTLRNVLDGEPLVLCNLQNSNSTYHCRAPETLEPNTTNYSTASDIYALGYCLRDMCFADTPFTPFVEHSVPEPFDKVFEACTRRTPQDRPLLEDLRNMVMSVEIGK